MVVHGALEPRADLEEVCDVFGLANHGSMCWFNSLIQMLLSLPNFVGEVRRCCGTLGPAKYPVMVEMDKFLAAAETASGTHMDAMPILTELMRACPGFGGRQEDAAEGLGLLLDKMHPDISRLFEVKYRMDIYCDSCRATIGEPCRDVMFAVPMERDFITIATSGDPFEQYLSGHMTKLSGWECPKCGVVADSDRHAMRIARLVTPPEILVVSFNKYAGKWTGPAYGQNIELPPPGRPDAAANYSLTSIIRHFGGPESGHYNTVCRRPSGIWLFDDTSTQRSAFQPGEVDYMLIYNRPPRAAPVARIDPGSGKIENRAP